MLQKLGFPSAETALNELALLAAANQLAQFRNECARFEEKYGMAFRQFERHLRKQRGRESFEAEEDLMAWRFAHEGATYWAPRVEELRRAV